MAHSTDVDSSRSGLEVHLHTAPELQPACSTRPVSASILMSIMMSMMRTTMIALPAGSRRGIGVGKLAARGEAKVDPVPNISWMGAKTPPTSKRRPTTTRKHDHRVCVVAASPLSTICRRRSWWARLFVSIYFAPARWLFSGSGGRLANSQMNSHQIDSLTTQLRRECNVALYPLFDSLLFWPLATAVALVDLLGPSAFGRDGRGWLDGLARCLCVASPEWPFRCLVGAN